MVLLVSADLTHVSAVSCQLGLFTWQDRIPREQTEVCKASWNVGPDLAKYHFYFILSAKESQEASPDSKDGAIDPPSS